MASKLATTRLVGLDDQVARHGWKIIVISRIQPIFPYLLINFAFGLTKIPLSSFIIATFFGLIPLTTAYVYFSANLLDLLKGNFSWGIFLALILISLAVVSPVFFRQLKRRPKKRMSSKWKDLISPGWLLGGIIDEGSSQSLTSNPFPGPCYVFWPTLIC